MKKVLLSLFAFIVCSYTIVQAQNVNQYITVYGHDFHSGYTDGVFSETRKIEIKNNSSYTLNIGTVYAYNYSTGDMFFIINYNGNADLPPYSSVYVTIENNSENNKYLSNMWVISVNYMNYNDYGNYSKMVKTKKGYVSNGTSGEFLEVFNPDNLFDNAIELSGMPVEFNLSSIDDADYFKVYASYADEITFKLKTNGEYLDGGDRIFKYEIFSEGEQKGLGYFLFNSYNEEQEATIIATQFNTNPYYIKIYYDQSYYPSEYYSDEYLTIQAFINGQPVSVEKVDKNRMAIYVQNGSIHVRDANGEAVLVYSIDGKLVYNNVSETDDISIRLTSGIYIVKVGKITKKIKL